MTRSEERTIAADKFTADKEYFVERLRWLDGAEWADSTAWKPADGDRDLPVINRRVVAIVEENGLYKVVFAHRPFEHLNGKNLLTGEITTYTPKKYGKGGWNQPNVKWWLDLELPIEE